MMRQHCRNCLSINSPCVQCAAAMQRQNAQAQSQLGQASLQSQLAQQGLLSQAAMQQQNAFAQQVGSGQALSQLYGIKPAAEKLQGINVADKLKEEALVAAAATIAKRPPLRDSDFEARVAESMKRERDEAEQNAPWFGLDLEAWAKQLLGNGATQDVGASIHFSEFDGAQRLHLSMYRIGYAIDRAFAPYIRERIKCAVAAHNQRANLLADQAQTLRDENTRLLAENARLRRSGRGR